MEIILTYEIVESIWNARNDLFNEENEYEMCKINLETGEVKFIYPKGKQMQKSLILTQEDIEEAIKYWYQAEHESEVDLEHCGFIMDAETNKITFSADLIDCR